MSVTELQTMTPEAEETELHAWPASTFSFLYC